MRVSFFIFVLALSCSFMQAAHAGQPEAREVARNNNCPPKKIDVYQQTMGSEGKTIYLVECTLPKTVGNAADAPPQATGLLISCDQSLCEVLRPMMDSGEKK